MAEMGTVEQPVNDGADTLKFHEFAVLPPVCTHVTVTELPLGAGLVSGSVAEIEVGFGVAVTLLRVIRYCTTISGRGKAGSGSGVVAWANPAASSTTAHIPNLRALMTSPQAMPH
jgi:hypothetical protein